ncbi:MAG: Rrf2 family transcriptional regulator [Dehalococcoidales bacterium]|nr:MAG: Rrf2 family transcriptional regulator [Dehalococcoidales bacterium]
MKLSTKGRYGTRALLELALHDGNTPIQLKDIAENQQISLPYLEQLVRPLVVNGYVRSTTGPKGGVALAKDPSDIKMIDIIQLYEGSIALVSCIDDPDLCERSSYCVTRDLWSELKDAMSDVLGSKTLQDLMNQQKEKNESKELMYYI